MFSVTANFTDKDLEAMIMGDVDEWFDELIQYFRTKGRELVDKARAKTKSDGGFGNITWNLRASIGMCIVDENGYIVETYFPPISKGAHGNTVGREMAERLAIYGRDLQQVSMVFVAGEEYASFVQSEERDVIKHSIGDNIEEALQGIM
jgi:hypothetical protein